MQRKAEIPFIIDSHSIHGDLLTLNLRGITADGEYRCTVEMISKIEIGPGVYFLGENSLKFVFADDSFLQMLTKKYSLDVPSSDFAREAVSYNLSPTGVIPQQKKNVDLENESIALKCFLDRGNVECYLQIDIKKSMALLYPRYDDEKYLKMFVSCFAA